MRTAAFCIAAAMVGGRAPAQAVQPDHTATGRADSLRLSGRPWHAAETVLAAARRDDYARTLLVNQPWLMEYGDGEALAVLAQAEFGLGRYTDAAAHFDLARARAPEEHAAVLAVRAGLAYEAAAQPDSAAAAYTLARAGGRLAAIDDWLRVHLARVSRDSAAARVLLTNIASPAARAVPVARARSLLLAGDTA